MWRQGKLDEWVRVMVLTQPIPSRLIENLANASDFEQVSAHQQRILRELADGKTIAEVATVLGKNYHTTKSHVKRCYQLLGAGNKVQAINRARELGLI